MPMSAVERSTQASADRSPNGLSLWGEGRRRVILERLQPEVDAGRYPIKRVPGEPVQVEVDAFADGHDILTCVVRYRQEANPTWQESPMTLVINDRWRGMFTPTEIGRYHYTVQSWVDHFKTWVHQLHRRVDAGQEVSVDLLIGADLVADAAAHTTGEVATRLRTYADALRAGDLTAAFAVSLAELMATYAPRRYATTYERELVVVVDSPLARFSSWYEIFPRSTSPEPGRHGTFRDVINRLPYVAELGFDILYLTPIHPIGQTFRKGKDNTPTAQPGEPGSPYAIGSAEGGHLAIHPELGTLEDFRELVRVAREQYGIEIALDNAFQCSPDHPYVREHPDWFRARPDGTIQYAENPPKKYQDIYPFDFESQDWQGMWYELKGYFDYWMTQGVRVFRVDNPHTKSFRFWEWCIGELKAKYPEAIFLSEAFTRPKVMYNLAKLGFTQSYTYFTWRTAKWELIQYMTELTQTEVKDYFRPNFWPNTHDILTPQFYPGHRGTFYARAALAATLAASWGLYGPAYELLEHMPVQGREEYRNNEKYELRTWNLDDPRSIRGFIGQLNRIRKENVALQRNESLRFHRVENNFTENDQIIAYSKQSADLSNIVLVVISLDPVNLQSAWVELPLADWGLSSPVQMHDLLSDQRYIWNDGFNYVELNPYAMPVHIFRLRRRVRDEHGFEFYS
ncbi:alpha-1,4-glucan--maltose-1-phosphate maltosyltransferase [Candidatus Oscillochloris fontis]|uniref:alpha-1,4-glucan--maltose-1-phosphate maltosyltransferase n=1 Tax=Candidatus Oscillochloris fontis TaxID=2496868 RepID=UPI001EE7B4AC|nr:alpha-1,4-glucan--maltose-1-phosphate maltosyltransferase [Candidatus Oscillochloris fontis]